MKKKTVLLFVALVLTGALAQDMSTGLETRLSIVENRLGRLEADVSRLSDVPVSLARIEQKLTTLAEKADGQGSVLQTVGLGIIMSVVTGVVSFGLGRKSQK
ncbi:MAG: hypothetical protein M0R28_21545 [Pigmentiphaga sp.]|nr:hypothetical protein [Pigmentiphaga sp.]